MKSIVRGVSPNRWNELAIFSWVVTVVVIFIRVLRSPHRQALFAQYFAGGFHWRHYGPLYHDPWGGFIYSPLVAAFFSLFTYIPEAFGNLAWRAILFATLIAGIAVALQRGPFRVVAPRCRAWVFLAILPFAIGNLDRAQANPLVVGLLLMAITAANLEKWTLAAVAVGIATCFKVYPLCVGMLLCMIWPAKITWRLAAVMVLFFALPFLLHDPHYVLAEYRSWIATRATDNRFQYPANLAPLDLWYLLVRVGRLPLSENFYSVIQVAGGLAAALYCLIARLRNWAPARILAGLFAFASVWMVLLGPATESATYLLLAPTVCIGFIQAFAFDNSSWVRGLASGAFALLLAGIVRDHAFVHTTSLLFRSVQPLSAIVFCAYAIVWLKNDAMWPVPETSGCNRESPGYPAQETILEELSLFSKKGSE